MPAMNWLRRLFGRKVRLDPEQALAVAAYRSRPPIHAATPLAGVRFVVVDVETSGLDPLADRLISIGAIEVSGGRVRLDSAFEVLFRQEQASNHANILIHGISGSRQRDGLPHAAAMIRFLDYAGTAPLAGFHADFDRLMIDRAARRAIAEAPGNPWLDLAFLAPALLAEPGRDLPQGLDGWAGRYGIENHARHNALADALATAQLLQVLLSRAAAAGAKTLADLQRIERDQRWLSRR